MNGLATYLCEFQQHGVLCLQAMQDQSGTCCENQVTSYKNTNGQVGVPVQTLAPHLHMHTSFSF